MQQPKIQYNRIIGLDIFRGWAILLMVGYHFSYDLNYFHYISVNLNHHPFFVYSRYIIVSIFLFSAGISLYIGHTPLIQWKKIKKRTFLLGSASILITLVTYFEFPHSWVYFGIIHFVLIATWIGLLFLPFPTLSLITAILIFLGSFLGWIGVHWLFEFLKIPLHLPPKYTEDVVRFFPWFGAVLLGISAAGYGLHHKLFLLPFFNESYNLNRYFSFIGRHSLVIYLLHQPLLFGIFFLFT